MLHFCLAFYLRNASDDTVRIVTKLLMQKGVELALLTISTVAVTNNDKETSLQKEASYSRIDWQMSISGHSNIPCTMLMVSQDPLTGLSFSLEKTSEGRCTAKCGHKIRIAMIQLLLLFAQLQK